MSQRINATHASVLNTVQDLRLHTVSVCLIEMHRDKVEQFFTTCPIGNVKKAEQSFERASVVVIHWFSFVALDGSTVFPPLHNDFFPGSEGESFEYNLQEIRLVFR